jgi:hypothetical protein
MVSYMVAVTVCTDALAGFGGLS